MQSIKKSVSVLVLLSMLVSMLALLPISVFAEDVTSAPAATDKESVLEVKWNKGYVGSKTHSTYKNKINASSGSAYSYTDVIVIPKKGTKIYFKDDISPYATFDCFVFSEWKKSGSSYVMDTLEGTNVFGSTDSKGDNRNGISVTNVSGGVLYEYVTDKDNQAIRICYNSSGHSKDVTVYQVLTDGKSTKQQMDDTSFTETFNANGTITGIQWFCGYASSETNTNGSAKEVKPYSADYLHSGLIRIPEKGTTVTFGVNTTYTPNTNINSITVYKKSGNAYVYSAGLNGTDTRVYSAKGDTKTYTYTSSADNEVIRVCFRYGTNGHYWQNDITVTAKWAKTGAAGTLGAKPVLDWPKEEIFSLTTGARLIGTEVPVKWNDGYIGSRYHASNAYKIAGGKNDVNNYTDVITVPKKGTTVYFFDETFTDHQGGSYASTSVLSVSHWKKSGSNWVIDMDKEQLDGCQVKNMIMNDYYRIYCYTTTEDNENIRLCLRQCPKDSGADDSIRPVYFVEPTDFEARVDAIGSFFGNSYTDPDGTTVPFEVYLPEDYNPEKQYTLIFDNSEDGAVSDLLAKCKYTGIIVKTRESGDRLIRLLEEVVLKYPVCISDVLFIGGMEIALYANEYDHLRIAQALLYIGNGTPKLPHTPAKNIADFETALAAAEWLVGESDNYYDVLEGITFYAIGDSYFGGSKIGQHRTWVNLLGNKYNMSYINYGIGGNTVAHFSGIPSNSPAMAVRISSLPEGGDIYFLEGGRNDRGKGVPIGKDTDMQNTTFKGALNIMIRNVLIKNPDALIILVTAWSYKGSENPSNDDYAKAMLDLVAYHNNDHIICLNAADAEWSGIDMAKADIRQKYCIASNDVSHLNVDGMNLVLTPFELWIAEQYARFKGVEMTNLKTLAKFDPSLLNAPEETPPVESAPSAGDTEAKKGCTSLVAAFPVMLAVMVGGVLSIKKKD